VVKMALPGVKTTMNTANEIKMPTDEAVIRKQLSEFVTNVIEIVDSIQEELVQCSSFEDTLKERMERDIKADAYDKILEVVNRPLE